MSSIVDTPEGIAFFQALSRRGLLEAEIDAGDAYGSRKRGQTAYSIVKQVYGFRGSRESVLADLDEYIAAELRIRHLTPEQFEWVKKVTQNTIDHFGDRLTQPLFEGFIERAEARGVITNGIRQGASDLFYVMIVRQNAGIG